MVADAEDTDLNDGLTAVRRDVQLLNLLRVLHRVLLEGDGEQVPVLIHGHADGGQDIERGRRDWC